MNKNYLLLIVFVLLGGATWWYLSDDKKSAGTVVGWDREFAVDRDQIGKVFIAKRSGETITIERKGKEWIYNDQHPASPGAVDNLLEAVSSMTLKFQPSPNATDNIISEMSARTISVEVYDRQGKRLKHYHIGGVTADARATYALMDGSNQPMAVEIPQMEGQIRTRFDLEEDQWRDRTVFGYEPEEIQAVSVEYPKQQSKSFRMTRTNDGFEVKPFYDNQVPISRQVSAGVVEGYLVGFHSLVAESFSNSFAQKDSVRQNIPFSIVSVTDRSGEEKKAAFYQSYKINTLTGERTADFVERYWADINTGDWMLTQHRVFKEIFWPYDAFFEERGIQVRN